MELTGFILCLNIGRVRLGHSECKYSLVHLFFLFDWSFARMVPNLPNVRMSGHCERPKQLKSCDTQKAASGVQDSTSPASRVRGPS